MSLVPCVALNLLLSDLLDFDRGLGLFGGLLFFLHI